MKNILLPVDFSENSQIAVDFAFQLFKGEEVKFHLIHAYFPPMSTPEVALSVNELLKDQAEGQMDQFINEIRSRYSSSVGFNITHEYYFGDVAYVIEKQAERTKASMIIMGTKGASGIKEVLIGSNTSFVISNVDIPVLIVPENVSFKGIKNILFPVDLKSTDDSILTPMLEILIKYNSKLSLLYIHNEDILSEETRTKLSKVYQDVLKEANHEYFYEFDQNIEKGIDQFVNEHAIDLIFMIKHKHSFFEKIFSESITRKMSMHAQVPLFIVKG